MQSERAVRTALTNLTGISLGSLLTLEPVTVAAMLFIGPFEPHLPLPEPAVGPTVQARWVCQKENWHSITKSIGEWILRVKTQQTLGILLENDWEICIYITYFLFIKMYFYKNSIKK